MSPPMAPAPDRPLVVLRGLLSVDVVRRGTASEQQALVLQADGGERFTLVKRGGPSFGLPAEAGLAGRRVEARGYLLGSELRFTQLAPL